MSVEENGSVVRVTLRDIYDSVQEIGTKLTIYAERSSANADAIEDHETRIRSLESRVWPKVALPLVAVAVAAVSAAAAFIR
jgi:hypothetical protein